MTTVTRIVTLDPSGSIILTTLKSDRGIKPEGKNVTTVTRIVALDPPGEPESHNLTTVTRIVTLDPSGSIICLTALTSDRGINVSARMLEPANVEATQLLIEGEPNHQRDPTAIPLSATMRCEV